MPEFEAVAYNLQKRQPSGIVESEYGLHLIQLMGRRGNSILSRHILVKPRMLDEDYTKAKTIWIQLKVIIKDTMSFEVALSRKYSDKNPNHLPMEVDYPIQKAAIISLNGDLDPDVYFAIDNLKVGEISDPVTSSESDGKKILQAFQIDF